MHYMHAFKNNLLRMFSGISIDDFPSFWFTEVFSLDTTSFKHHNKVFSNRIVLRDSGQQVSLYNLEK